MRLKIEGITCGHTWMGGFAIQGFSKSVTRKPRESTYDMLKDFTMSGDFQDPKIYECILSITYTKGNRTVTKTFDLSQSVAAKGLFYEGDSDKVLDILYGDYDYQ